MSKNATYVILSVTLGLGVGFILGAHRYPEVVTQTKTVSPLDYSRIKDQQPKWRQLKTIDDAMMIKFSTTTAICTELFDAHGRYDLRTVEQGIVRVNEQQRQLEVLNGQRREKLNELGY